MRKLLAALAIAAAAAAAPAARAEFIDLMSVQDDVGQLKAPRFGRSRLLVLPVEIRGIGLATLPNDRLVRFFESESTEEFRFRSYMGAASNGRFQPDVEVAPTVVFDGCPAELEGRCEIAGTELTMLGNAMALLRTVFRRAHEGCFVSGSQCDASRGVDFSRYDQNGMFGADDGFIDGVMLVTNLSNVYLSIPIAPLNAAGPDDLAGGIGGSFVLDRTQVSLVSVCGTPTEGAALPEQVCAHEFGHLLGLADTYQQDTWSAVNPGLEYLGLQFSSMSDWKFGPTGLFPDAESRYRLQWADVTVVSGTQRITLAPAAAGGRVVKLGMMTPEHREYWLAEVRSPVGVYDRSVVDSVTGAKVSGLSVYHVDWSKGPSGEPGSFVKQLFSCLNCDPWRPFIMNVQADRRFDIQAGGTLRPEDDLFMNGDALSPIEPAGPFARLNPFWGANYYDGTPAGIRIENISVDPETGFVTADFTAPAVADPCADLSCGPGQLCFEGNCRTPTDEPPVVIPPALRDDERDTEEEGWGCTQAAIAPALALAAILLRRRRA